MVTYPKYATLAAKNVYKNQNTQFRTTASTVNNYSGIGSPFEQHPDSLFDCSSIVSQTSAVTPADFTQLLGYVVCQKIDNQNFLRNTFAIDAMALLLMTPAALTSTNSAASTLLVDRWLPITIHGNFMVPSLRNALRKYEEMALMHAYKKEPLDPKALLLPKLLMKMASRTSNQIPHEG